MYIQLPDVDEHLLRCLKSTMLDSFIPGKLLYVSVPKFENLNFKLAESIINHVNKDELWPLLISTQNNRKLFSSDEDSYKHHNYVLFSSLENSETEIFGDLSQQLEVLKGSRSWNTRGIYIVIVETFHDSLKKSLAVHISKFLWEMYRITKIIVFFHYRNRFGDTSAEFYIWIPYNDGNCRDPKYAKLLGDFGKSIILDHKIYMDLFSAPNNAMGCPIRVFGMNLFLYKTTLRGLNVENYKGLDNVFLLFAQDVMNFTIEISENNETDISIIIHNAIGQIIEGTSDVAIGYLWLKKERIEISDFTISLYFDRMEWYVPCPEYSHKMEHVLHMYSEMVWASIILVLVVSALVFRCLTEIKTERFSYRTLPQCFSNAWSVLLGFSVPKLPRTYKLKGFFLSYLCYSFMMTTVFQAFFVSFLVEPG